MDIADMCHDSFDRRTWAARKIWKRRYRPDTSITVTSTNTTTPIILSKTSGGQTEVTLDAGMSTYEIGAITMNRGVSLFFKGGK